MIEKEGTLAICGSILIGLVGLAVYACISIYAYWKNRLKKVQVPGSKAKINLVVEVLATIIILFYSMLAFGSVGAYFWLLFFPDEI